MALEYKAILKVINKNSLCIAMHSLVMSPYSHDAFWRLVHNYNGYYSSLTYWFLDSDLSTCWAYLCFEI